MCFPYFKKSYYQQNMFCETSKGWSFDMVLKNTIPNDVVLLSTQNIYLKFNRINIIFTTNSIDHDYIQNFI